MQNETTEVESNITKLDTPFREKLDCAVSIGCAILYVGGIIWGLLADDGIRSRIWWNLTKLIQAIASAMGRLGIETESAYYHTVEMMHS